MATNQANHTTDVWSDILQLAHSGNGRALQLATSRIETTLKKRGIWPKPSEKQGIAAALRILSSCIDDIPNLQDVYNANRIRNMYTHADEHPYLALTPKIVVGAVSVLKDFEVWLLTVEISKSKSTNEIATEPQEAYTQTSDTIAEHTPPLPPPPNVSYHPAFFVPREAETSRVLSCLLHPGNPVIVQGPALFGKRAFVSNFLEQLAHSVQFLLLNYNGQAKTCSLTENPTVGLSPNHARPLSAKGLAGMIKDHFLGKVLVVLIVEYFDNITEEDLELLMELHEKNHSHEELSKRLMLIFTTSAPPAHLSKYSFCRGYNMVCLSEFDKHQMKQLIALHGLEFSDDTIDTLHANLGGHPYLLRALLYESTLTKKTEALFHPDSIAQPMQLMVKALGRPYSDSLYQLHKNERPADRRQLNRFYQYGFVDGLSQEDFSPRRFLLSDLMSHFFDLSYYTVDIVDISPRRTGKSLRLHIPVFDSYFVSPSDFNDVFAEFFRINYDGLLRLRIKDGSLYITALSTPEEQNTGALSGIIIFCIDLLYDEELLLPNETLLNIENRWFEIYCSKGYKPKEKT
ncbi:MAG: AAA-like domain-containing protein [Myxococcales bacterium]|nr:AAA-like domain-containing protein [Myxococcales bacterium]